MCLFLPLFLQIVNQVQESCFKCSCWWKAAINPVKYDDFILWLCWDHVHFFQLKRVCIHSRLTVAEGNAQVECCCRQQLRNVLFTYLLETQGFLEKQTTSIPISKQSIGKIREKHWGSFLRGNAVKQDVLNTKSLWQGGGEGPFSDTPSFVKQTKIESNLIILAIGCYTSFWNAN